MSDIQRILVPVDFSECAKHALEYALRLAAKLGASIEALHVWTLPATLPGDAGHTLRTAAGETLESLARAEANRQMADFLHEVIKPPNVALTTAIAFGQEAEVITGIAKGFDLIVMGTNGRTGISLWVVGSIAEKVVRSAPCPVLTVRLPR
jgi:universal stress protein A